MAGTAVDTPNRVAKDPKPVPIVRGGNSDEAWKDGGITERVDTTGVV